MATDEINVMYDYDSLRTSTAHEMVFEILDLPREEKRPTTRCDKCGKPFKTADGLARHVAKKHGDHSL